MIKYHASLNYKLKHDRTIIYNYNYLILTTKQVLMVRGLSCPTLTSIRIKKSSGLNPRP